MIMTTHRDHLGAVLLALAILAALAASAGASPARAALPDEAFPDGHGPVALEKDGDIWVATRMHLANLTSNTADSTEKAPVVSPDGRYVAFASNRDRDFEIYVANVFTGDAQRVTDNPVDDRKPSWTPDGQLISYQSSYYPWPTHSGIFLASVRGTLAP